MPPRASVYPEEVDRNAPYNEPQSQGGKSRSFTTANSEMNRKSDSLDRRKSDKPFNLAPGTPNGSAKSPFDTAQQPLLSGEEKQTSKMGQARNWRHWNPKNPWACSLPTIAAATLAITLLLSIIHAFVTRQLDPKGCDMCWSAPIYVRFKDFDTEHTRFASKYSLYMLKEGGVDEDPKVKGVPILFIPGNAGSYKQARCLEHEAAIYYHNVIQHNPDLLKGGTTSLDFFTVDFNEDFSAFHGQTLLDQAEYVNDAVAYILSLYHDSRRVQRGKDLPDPSSVILIGHSMGGVVARAMLTMPNYQSNSINTIITMSAPHARPPVSVDSDLVYAYKKVNDYWRQAHQQKWANDNPLWHVTLISIAGGGLDTVVPSDYASLESLLPDTHGFTVFTSGIPNVWTGADHIQTTWCVQLMKAIMRSTFDILDVHRPGQTKPRSERMRIFKKWYLTGMEDTMEKALPQQEASTLMPLERDASSLLKLGQRLALRKLGQHQGLKAYMMPIPSHDPLSPTTFTLLSDQSLFQNGEILEVLLCSTTSPQPGQSPNRISMSLDFSGEAPGSPRLACKSAGQDIIALPASTRLSSFPFEKNTPMSYLQYDASDLEDYRYVAIVDKATEHQTGWLLAEFASESKSSIVVNLSLQRLLSFGLRHKLPADRSLVSTVHIPALHSSLLAFNLRLGPQTCGDEAELFTPLLRQYLEEPHESKFFVNVKNANISLHGVAPFMPPPMRAQSKANHVSLQLWSDPTCDSSVNMSLDVDIAGSLGKLVMRYRLVFAAFPLLVVALVLRKQFSLYDETGIFITFAEAMDVCLRSSIPVLVLALSLLAISMSAPDYLPPAVQKRGFFGSASNSTESVIDFTKNDLLLGSQDQIFWVLVPLFGLLSVGVCVLVNYATLGLTYLFYLPYSYIILRPAWAKMEDISGRSIGPTFSPSTPRRRLITTCILLIFVSTLIPYQFAFLDAVLVQLLTCTRALRLAKSSSSMAYHNFYNYSHSILVLMLWVLPINIPVLVVWIHNLAVHWLTPFSSHHNIISIMPYLILVETLTSGKMIPQLHASPARYVTNIAFFGLAVYAAVYGVSYAYMLHHLVNGVFAWLVAIHIWGNGGVDLKGMKEILEGGDGDGDTKKQP